MFINNFKSYNGLTEHHSLESNSINYNIKIDLKKFKKKKAVDKISQQKVEEQTTDTITTDEDGNATVDFISVTKNAELKFTYKETYQSVKELREKEGFNCTTN